MNPYTLTSSPKSNTNEPEALVKALDPDSPENETELTQYGVQMLEQAANLTQRLRVAEDIADDIPPALQAQEPPEQVQSEAPARKRGRCSGCRGRC